MVRLTALALLSSLSVHPSAGAQQANAEALFNSAVSAQQRGDFDAAILDYKKLLKIAPALAEAHANLGAALAHEGRFGEAIAEDRLALPNAIDKDGVRLNLGLAYYKKGDLTDASREFRELRKRRPADPQLAILFGDSEVRLGHAREAVAMLTPLEPANAANPDFEYVLGEAEIASGQRRAGADRLTRVGEATQGADAYFLAGSTLMELNAFEAARADLEAALKLNPALPHVYTLVGMARDKTGDQAAAEPAFRQALKANPEDFDANLYLGAILYKRRDLEEAKPYLAKAVALNAANSMAEYMFAMWQSTEGDYADAAQRLEGVVKTDPDWLEPHIELATVYYRLHRPDDGAKEREIVARLRAQEQAKGPGK